MNRAIRRVGIALIVLLAILVGQLTYLQIVDANHLSNDPRDVRAALRDANRPRGPIVTSDGEVVAQSTPSHDKSEFKYQRSYPTGSLFSQIVGYQSFVFGNVGVENTYNSSLVGRDADLQLQNVLSGGDTGTVVLALSGTLQRVAQQALGNQRGSVVAIDPKTGKILAMYSNPSYDPNALASHDTKVVQDFFTSLTNDPNQPNLPRSYRERYPPGSTFKTVTASVALEDGIATPQTVFPVLNQLTLPQTTNVLKNFGGESCGGTLAVSFAQSCNTTFGQIGLNLGDLLPKGADHFGINDTPPFDVSPGAVGSIGPLAGTFQNNQPLFAFAGIGQGDVATTPLEMALIASGIANGGVIMQPHAVAEIRDSDNKLVRKIDNETWKTAMSPATAQAVTSMMVQVVQNGTGTAAQIPGVTVAGKTGTAEVANGNPHAWFIGFAPAEAPQIAVAVLVEHGGNANSEITGGRIAAPIAKQVIQAALGH